LLIGELAPQQGEVRLGANVSTAYFDQLRDQLDETKSILDNVGEGGDFITVNGKPRNIVGYLEGFLFAPERIHAPIHTLSGGERNRLLLAKLLARPANLLVLDEPTNDLDIETVEILEDLLLEFSGTLLVVSHDRTFLNNLATSILALDGTGKVGEYIGGYDDWQRQIAEEKVIEEETPQKRKLSAAKSEATENEGRRKPGYKEKRLLEAQKKELAETPGRIEALESEQAVLAELMAEPTFYQQDSAQIAQAVDRARELDEELTRLYQRWQELVNILEP
jgi:ABC transport system ATP-binding/permease protein